MTTDDYRRTRDILTNDDVYGMTGHGTLFLPDAWTRARDENALDQPLDPTYATLKPVPKPRWTRRRAG